MKIRLYATRELIYWRDVEVQSVDDFKEQLKTVPFGPVDDVETNLRLSTVNGMAVTCAILSPEDEELRSKISAACDDPDLIGELEFPECF